MFPVFANYCGDLILCIMSDNSLVLKFCTCFKRNVTHPNGKLTKRAEDGVIYPETHVILSGPILKHKADLQAH